MDKHQTLPPTHNAFVNHPWHGIDINLDETGVLTSFIELVPGEDLKFELDKPSGWLKIDRPQKFSSRPPVMYGLIPKTYCGDRVGARCTEVTKLPGIVGDGDPMDILLLAEHAPAFGGFLARARVLGGLRMVDGGEADDKIIGVLEGDPAFGGIQQIADVPKPLIDRLLHYFTTYKQPPNSTGEAKVSIREIYDRAEALNMVKLSEEDYVSYFHLKHVRG